MNGLDCSISLPYPMGQALRFSNNVCHQMDHLSQEGGSGFLHSIAAFNYAKEKVYILTLPHSIRELQDRIHDAVMSVNEVILHRTCDKIAFGWDKSDITCGSHIEHL